MCVNKKSRVVKTTSMYSVTTAVQIAFMSGREWWLCVQGSICGDLAADRRLYASKRVCAPIAWAALELKDEFAAQQMVTVKVQLRMKSRSGTSGASVVYRNSAEIFQSEFEVMARYVHPDLRFWLAPQPFYRRLCLLPVCQSVVACRRLMRHFVSSDCPRLTASAVASLRLRHSQVPNTCRKMIGRRHRRFGSLLDGC